MTGSPPPEWEEAARWPLAFAQVREDPLLDREAIEGIGPGPLSALLVASGGCTAAYLAPLPCLGRLVLVDPSPAQLAYSRLKLELLARHSPAERLALLGHGPLSAGRRARQLGERLEALDLDPEILGPPRLWSARGPDHCGRYEELFAALRRRLEPHRPRLEALLEEEEPGAGPLAPETPLGQALDRALGEVFALPVLERLFGPGATRGPALPFAEHFARRIRRAVARGPVRNNPWLWQMLRGAYPPGFPAPWLGLPARPVRASVGWSCSTLLERLEAGGERHDYIHLSNILDWLSAPEAARTLEQAARRLRPGGRILARQLNSRLDVPAAGPQFLWREERSARMLGRDRSFFYRRLHLGELR